MTAGVVVGVQARLASTRLPKKVLAPIGSVPLLKRLLDRLTDVVPREDVVAAVPENEHELIRRITAWEFRVVAGSADDVLARYVSVLRVVDADAVVRVTADCPLLDVGLLGRLLVDHASDPVDYLGTRGYPRGLGDIEILSAEALLRSQRESTQPRHREHVVPYILENPSRFRIRFVDAPADCHAPQYRLCVDEAADLRAVRAVWRLLPNPARFTARDVVELLRAHPEIAAMNAEVVQRS